MPSNWYSAFGLNSSYSRHNLSTHCVSVAFRDALRDNFLVAIFVASVLAVFTLNACTLEEEFAAERACDDGVELLLHKLMTILLVNLLFAFAHGALTAETASIVRPLADIRFDCRH